MTSMSSLHRHQVAAVFSCEYGRGWLRLSCLIALACWLNGATTVHAQTNAPTGAGVNITADEMEQDKKTGFYKATGHVHILRQDHELFADVVDLNQKTGVVHARGHVTLIRAGQGKWTGEALDYNYLTKAGLLGTGVIHAGMYNIVADEVSRDTNGVLHCRHARMTTCTNDVDDWHYYIAADRVDYRTNESVTVHDAVPTFFGVPVFYIPSAERDLNHDFGPNAQPGYHSQWGAYLLTAYAYPIYNPPDATDEIYGNVLLDYRTRRGLGYGHELDWSGDSFGKGWFGAYGAHDLDASNKDSLLTNLVSSSRYRIYLHEEADITPRDQLLVNGDNLSDPLMLKDYYPKVFNHENQPDNFFAYDHRGLDYAAGVEASGPLNNFYTGVGRLPEGWLSVMPQELLGGSGLYYESESRAGYLVQQWAKDGSLTNGFPAEPDTTRLHTFQKVTAPFQLFDSVSIVPRAAYDGTFYSHLQDAGEDETRSILEAGAEISCKAYGTFDNIRHIVEPYVDYSVVGTPLGLKTNQNFFFDSVDGPREWSDLFGLNGVTAPRRYDGIRPGIRNTLQTRNADGKITTFFDSDLFVACRVGSDDAADPSGLRLAGWNMTLKPIQDVTLHTEGLYDTKMGRTDQSDSSIRFFENRENTYEIGYFRSDPLSPNILNPPADPALLGYNDLPAESLARASITHRFGDQLCANTFIRYDTTDSMIDEIGGYVQYDLDCMFFRVTTGYMPPFSRYDGTHRSADFVVSFLFTVKAFEPSSHATQTRGW